MTEEASQMIFLKHFLTIKLIKSQLNMKNINLINMIKSKKNSVEIVIPYCLFDLF